MNYRERAVNNHKLPSNQKIWQIHGLFKIHEQTTVNTIQSFVLSLSVYLH